MLSPIQEGSGESPANSAAGANSGDAAQAAGTDSAAAAAAALDDGNQPGAERVSKRGRPRKSAPKTAEERKADAAARQRKHRAGEKEAANVEPATAAAADTPATSSVRKPTRYVNRSPLPSCTVTKKTLMKDLNKPVTPVDRPIASGMDKGCHVRIFKSLDKRIGVVVTHINKGDPAKNLQRQQQTRAEFSKLEELIQKGVKTAIEPIRYAEAINRGSHQSFAALERGTCSLNNVVAADDDALFASSCITRLIAD